MIVVKLWVNPTIVFNPVRPSYPHHNRILRKHVKSGRYQPASKTPSERRFAGGPIVALDWILAGHIICRGRPLNSFDISRATNSIDPDQTEPTLFAKNISKIFQQRTKQTSLIVISVFFGLRDFVYFQNVILFSEKCADPDEKSYYACGNSSRPHLGESTKGKQNYLAAQQNIEQLQNPTMGVTINIKSK